MPWKAAAENRVSGAALRNGLLVRLHADDAETQHDVAHAGRPSVAVAHPAMGARNLPAAATAHPGRSPCVQILAPLPDVSEMATPGTRSPKPR